MKRNPANEGVLGIFVGDKQIEAVLIASAEGGTRVVNRFQRPRSKEGSMASQDTLAMAVPGLKGSDDNDFTIQVGDGGMGGGGDDMFFETEFSGAAATTRQAEHVLGQKPTNGQDKVQPFLQPLKEILEESAKAGFPNPHLAFCIQPPELSYVTLQAPSDDKGTAKKPLLSLDARSSLTSGGVTYKQLGSWLAAQKDAPAFRDRAAFVPLASRNGVQRHLAVVPEQRDSVSATMELFRRQAGAPHVNASLLDSELTLYRSVALGAKGKQELVAGKTTAIVRVGSEDTLVLFFAGRELRHYERLRSLTTYDSPQTICSRVLLQQDEQKIGAVDRLYLASDSRSTQLLDAFATFYVDADVCTFAELFEGFGIKGFDKAAGAGTVLATSAALRVVRSGGAEDGINLMPERLRRKRRRTVGFAWHTGVMMLVLFAVTMHFVMKYEDGAELVSQARLELEQNPPPPPLDDPVALKHRVDSLQAAYTMYTRSLATLDSLLLGSDRWSRFLESTARSTGDISGLWIDSWSPQGSNVKLQGAALNRTRVAQFARRLSGSIESVSTHEIQADGRPVQLYNFSMVVPVPVNVPRVADYLKQVAAGDIAAGDETDNVRPEDMHFHEDTPMTNVERERSGATGE